MIETAPQTEYGSLSRFLRGIEVGQSFLIRSGQVGTTLHVLAGRIGIRVASRKDDDNPGFHRVWRLE